MDNKCRQFASLGGKIAPLKPQCTALRVLPAVWSHKKGKPDCTQHRCLEGWAAMRPKRSIVRQLDLLGYQGNQICRFLNKVWSNYYNLKYSTLWWRIVRKKIIPKLTSSSMVTRSTSACASFICVWAKQKLRGERSTNRSSTAYSLHCWVNATEDPICLIKQHVWHQPASSFSRPYLQLSPQPIPWDALGCHRREAEASLFPRQHRQGWHHWGGAPALSPQAAHGKENRLGREIGFGEINN